MSDLPYPENRGQTHSEGCYRWPKHHNCAVRLVDKLSARVAELEADKKWIASAAEFRAMRARVAELEAALKHTAACNNERLRPAALHCQVCDELSKQALKGDNNDS